MAKMDIYQFFQRHWKKACKMTGIKAGGKKTFLGWIQLKDFGGVVHEVMNEWTEYYSTNRSSWIDDLFASVNSQKKLRSRFVTKSEYNRIFDEKLGRYLDSGTSDAKESQYQRKQKEKEQDKKNAENYGEYLDNRLERSLFSSSKDEVQEFRNAFYQDYPIFSLLGVEDELDRKRIANFLEEKPE